MNTANLIRNLAADAKPVKRLPHPMVRAAVWLAISLSYVVAITLVYRMSGKGIPLSLDERFLFEELATVVTAVTAAVAAFCCVVPGRDRRIAFLPLLPLAVWLASIGEACANELLRLGSGVFSLRVGWECLPASALIGVLPAVAMVIMLRRGAPLYPRSTVVLGALAVAALGNLGLRLFHAGDVTIMMLIWHLGAMALLMALAYWIGPRALSWRHEIVGRRTVA
jgi:hypothetical protein